MKQSQICEYTMDQTTLNNSYIDILHAHFIDLIMAEAMITLIIA